MTSDDQSFFFVACEFVTFQEPFNTAIEIEEKKKNFKKHTEAALCERSE